MPGKRSERNRYWRRHLHEQIPCDTIWLKEHGEWWRYVVAGDRIMSMQRSDSPHMMGAI